MNIPNEAIEQAADALNAQWPHMLCDGVQDEVARAALEATVPLMVSAALEEAGSWCCEDDYTFLRRLADEQVGTS